MPSFELILEFTRPEAAIIPERLPARQFNLIYFLLPQGCRLQQDLADRWNVALVIASDDWASTQRRRVPCFKPKGVRLNFAQ